ncbi:uncharacterized protein LOC128554502 [Mercenaria mercenaria]|uniref:uncharacterized protein LOC128554502 n=1 Tax=Mercenaria mercenaria TaxID=6596 RepID=UPI00234E7303|nr:uncharacterized protein LOC128554502 [Mercenaria mercenaria]
MTEHGPAYLLRFIYKNGSKRNKYLHVDLVPAFKVLVKKDDTSNQYFKLLDARVKLKAFRECVLKAEHYLSVNSRTSFTETEVYFMKNVLSKTHVKVYRILKILLNGHGDDEKMKKECIKRDVRNYHVFSSYLIKTMMIYHHKECTNPDMLDTSGIPDIGPCVLQILEELCKFDETNRYPNFSGIFRGGDKYCMVPFLQNLADTLKAMQISGAAYEYKRCRMKSMSRQFIEKEIRAKVRRKLINDILLSMSGPSLCALIRMCKSQAWKRSESGSEENESLNNIPIEAGTVYDYDLDFV